MQATAGHLLRDARGRAGLTQSELAVRAGVTQSVISAYESGRREPGFDMLRKLIGATGFALDLGLIPNPRSPLALSVTTNAAAIKRALEALGAENIRLFGSVARDQDGPDSDVDFLIDIDDQIGLFALAQMRSEAERILGVSVDIVPSNSLKAELAATVMAEAVPL